MLNDHLFLCPVCGFGGLTSAPYDPSGCASFDLCPCCGTEFGYDDASVTHHKLRRQWLVAGAPWRSSCVGMPEGWNAVEQLQASGLAE